MTGLGKERDTAVVFLTQTMHTYGCILKQLAESMQLGTVAARDLEKQLIQAAWRHVHAQKTLYIVIEVLSK